MWYGCHSLRGLTNSDPAGHNIVAGHLSVCLCISVLSGFLDSHPVAKKVVDGAGRNNALNYFTNLVSSPLFTFSRLYNP